MAEEKRIWWKKTEGGSLILQGKVINKGEKFQAYPWQIPKQFRDVIIPLEEVPGEEPAAVATKAPAASKKSVYKAVPRGKSKVQFDVINPDVVDEEGKPKRINAKVLSRKTAEQLVKDLE